jgi:hypothetical protein
MAAFRHELARSKTSSESQRVIDDLVNADDPKSLVQSILNAPTPEGTLDVPNEENQESSA